MVTGIDDSTVELRKYAEKFVEEDRGVEGAGAVSKPIALLLC